MCESIQLSTPIDNSSSVDSAAAGAPSLLTNLVQKYSLLHASTTVASVAVRDADDCADGGFTRG